MNLLIDKVRIAACFLFLLFEGLRDYRKQKIYILPVGIFFCLGMIFSLIQGKEDFLYAILGSLTGGLLLFLSVVTKEKIGFGDGLVIIATGALLGFKVNLLMLLIGLFLAALKGIWILISGKGGKNDTMPFLPFLLPGLTLSLARLIV